MVLKMQSVVGMCGCSGPVTGRIIHDGSDHAIHIMQQVVQFRIAGMFRPQWRGNNIMIPCAPDRDTAGADIDQGRVNRQHFFSQRQAAIENDLVIRELLVAPGPDRLADVEPVHDPQVMLGDGKFSVLQYIG